LIKTIHIGRSNLYLPDSIKLFEDAPEGIWDPAFSMVLEERSGAAALLLGDSGRPYGSFYLLLLTGRLMTGIYLIPASSPAVPYALANLKTLKKEELADFWNLQPIQFGQPVRSNPESWTHDFVVSNLDVEDFQVDLRGCFRECREFYEQFPDSQEDVPLGLLDLELSNLRPLAR
jgi:hypothetical protein